MLNLFQLALIKLLCLNEDRLVVNQLEILPVLLENHVGATTCDSEGCRLLRLSLIILPPPSIFRVALCGT